jgi:hypothetical protein
VASKEGSIIDIGAAAPTLNTVAAERGKKNSSEVRWDTCAVFVEV